jgi:ATP-dependent RNA helicase DOB1
MLTQKIEVMESRLTSNPLYNSPDLERIYQQYQVKLDLTTKMKVQKKKIQAANSVMQLDELKNRKRVLRRLGFTSANDVIEMKGRYLRLQNSANVVWPVRFPRETSYY